MKSVCLTSLFYRDCRRKLNQVSPSNFRVTILDRLQQLERVDQARVGAVVDLGLEADRSISTPLPASPQSAKTTRQRVAKNVYWFQGKGENAIQRENPLLNPPPQQNQNA